MPGGQFLELFLLKWSDFDNSKIAAGHFTHNYGLDRKLIIMNYTKENNCTYSILLQIFYLRIINDKKPAKVNLLSP